jgi:hypothetical protein
MSLFTLTLVLACAATPPSASEARDPALPPESRELVNADRAPDISYLPEIETFNIEKERVYYTTVNFWYEWYMHKTTNYERGVLVPINSRAMLMPTYGLQPAARRTSHKPQLLKINVRLLDSDTTITIGNIEKYSQTSLHEIIYRMFSPEPVDLGLFDEEMQGASRRSSASRHTSHWG